LGGSAFLSSLNRSPFVRQYVKLNKTDAIDAAAIWEIVQRPGTRFVAGKMREQLINV
jgi:transposase